MVYLKPDGDLFCWQRTERNFSWIWIPELWWKPGCKTWFFSGLTTQDYKRSERHACMPFAGEDFVCQWPKINAARGDECKQSIHIIASTRMCWNLQGEESPRSSPSVSSTKSKRTTNQTKICFVGSGVSVSGTVAHLYKISIKRDNMVQNSSWIANETNLHPTGQLTIEVLLPQTESEGCHS